MDFKSWSSAMDRPGTISTPPVGAGISTSTWGSAVGSQFYGRAVGNRPLEPSAFSSHLLHLPSRTIPTPSPVLMVRRLSEQSNHVIIHFFGVRRTWLEVADHSWHFHHALVTFWESFKQFKPYYLGAPEAAMLQIPVKKTTHVPCCAMA
ncbi:hypothetical protein EIP91_004372 [Steccherinum ochraceum]|uniref:Uncharacterized protein n=1 Tax=Steccherinum ochraceum TaxID=92696 RepID=A0A4R0RSC6_9APHY|nr:hypothetical protein EIP91_004372 [Steccherinum ochraceum]